MTIAKYQSERKPEIKHERKIDFGALMERVAYRLWGKPNDQLSSQGELRWGNRGSRKVDLDKGTWFDFEKDEGGGTLALIERERCCNRSGAIRWLEEQGFIPPEKLALGPVVARYNYNDENGKLLFQVTRHDPKDFRQRQPQGSSGWIWNIVGVRPVLYRLPELIEAVKEGKRINICEGEKDVQRFEREGLVATTNPGGASKGKSSLRAFMARRM
jgi:hypothetical protein